MRCLIWSLTIRLNNESSHNMSQDKTLFKTVWNKHRDITGLLETPGNQHRRHHEEQTQLYMMEIKKEKGMKRENSPALSGALSRRSWSSEEVDLWVSCLTSVCSNRPGPAGVSRELSTQLTRCILGNRVSTQTADIFSPSGQDISVCSFLSK